MLEPSCLIRTKRSVNVEGKVQAGISVDRFTPIMRPSKRLDSKLSIECHPRIPRGSLRAGEDSPNRPPKPFSVLIESTNLTSSATGSHSILTSPTRGYQAS
ncbi:hypothetical protein K458DRAFT_60256 [Lentithecium fluviatile CBS 122367]|uniref:Uncharacterized protein n=1 Tax=Lentithecium fluviatile CBS 122367 TaxID=1168545 RepID=A0A6G1IWA2_9PLEO|nr:hypothetical protein K458DRAFT_60256 [Lentithecium fluviatile CBS 122367]